MIGSGVQYMLKAKQQVEHKSSARGIGSFQQSGVVSRGRDGAQALGELGIYGLLAQDAREFLRDAQLYKSENRPEVWDALKSGKALPGGRVPGSFNRFQNYLKATGVNIDHDSAKGTLRLTPFTDKEIKKIARSSGKDNLITRPTETVLAGSLKPTKGGLFDVDLTGGKGGDKWSRFELSTRIPNPIYEGSIKNILGISNKDFDKILTGSLGVKIGDDEEPIYGPGALTKMLEKVDIEDVRKRALDIAQHGKDSSKRSTAYKTLKSLKMLDRQGLSPMEGFTRNQVLVLPSNMRDYSIDKSTGDFIVGDINYLYRDIALTDKALSDAKARKAPPKIISELEGGLYDSMRSLMQTEGSSPLSNADYQGIIGIVTGRRPSIKEGKEVTDLKQSLFRKHLIQRRQVMSGRTVFDSSR